MKETFHNIIPKEETKTHTQINTSECSILLYNLNVLLWCYLGNSNFSYDGNFYGDSNSMRTVGEN